MPKRTTAPVKSGDRKETSVPMNPLSGGAVEIPMPVDKFGPPVLGHGDIDQHPVNEN